MKFCIADTVNTCVNFLNLTLSFGCVFMFNNRLDFTVLADNTAITCWVIDM
ncbi:Uncharacterised protein [Acinetobacter baumannii]|nr:Uncharacterised protein [Acinetobacter baumannii]